jgi:hypothetical protein
MRDVIIHFGAFAKWRKATVSFVMSVHLSICLSGRLSAWNNWVHWREFCETWYLSCWKICLKSRVSLKSDNNNGTLHKDQYTLFIASHSVPRLRNVTDKSCTENQNIHFVSVNLFYENLTVYEIMWENIAQPDRPQMTVRRMSIACCIFKATDTHKQHVILMSFPLQQQLHEITFMLYYTYIAVWLVLLLYIDCIIVIRHPDDCHRFTETCCCRIATCHWTCL